MLNLQKEDRTKINGTIIQFGLGWDSRVESSVGGMVGGFLQKFSGTNRVSQERAIDLDASAILYSNSRRVGETSFRTLRSPMLPAGTHHSGDNRTGAGKGEDEIITIDTSKLNPTVDCVVLVINSFSGEPLSSVANTLCNIRVDGQPEATMSLLTKEANYTAVVMGRFYKKDGQWRFQNISEFTNARMAADMDRFIQQYL